MSAFGVCFVLGLKSLRYEVDLAADVLSVTLHVTNPGDEAFDFQVTFYLEYSMWPYIRYSDPYDIRYSDPCIRYSNPYVRYSYAYIRYYDLYEIL